MTRLRDFVVGYCKFCVSQLRQLILSTYTDQMITKPSICSYKLKLIHSGVRCCGKSGFMHIYLYFVAMMETRGRANANVVMGVRLSQQISHPVALKNRLTVRSYSRVINSMFKTINIKNIL